MSETWLFLGQRSRPIQPVPTNRLRGFRLTRFALALGAVLLWTTNASAQTAAPAAAPATAATSDWPEAYIEIFKLAPGKQEEFIRRLARNDAVTAAAGLPPMQMFMHQDGADWDVLLLKPARTKPLTSEQEAAMAAKKKELGVESGPAYFVSIRSLIASHTDTKTYGPISAATWLERLDSWRTEHAKLATGKPAKK